MATESDLLRAIIDAPDDNDLKAVFADWLEDHDREKEADAYRFCASHDLHPWSHSMSEDGWSWYPDEGRAAFGRRAILPPWLHKAMGEFDLLHGGWHRESFARAMLALAEALKKCPRPTPAEEAPRCPA